MEPEINFCDYSIKKNNLIFICLGKIDLIHKNNINRFYEQIGKTILTNEMILMNQFQRKRFLLSIFSIKSNMLL